MTGSVLAGRFRVEDQVGSGGMGAVYSALDSEIDEIVALKVLHADLASNPKFRTMLRAEMQLVRRIRHPAVCNVFDIHRHREGSEELTFFTMEFLTGVPLSVYLTDRGRIPIAEALPVTQRLAKGLSVLHEHGVVHRDFKPANIMVKGADSESLLPTIMDFGLAQTRSKDESARQSGVFGTPPFMAPERWTSAEPHPRLDVYSFGVVVDELVDWTSDAPLTTKDALRGLVSRCTAHLPEERPLDGSALLQAIDELRHAEKRQRPRTLIPATARAPSRSYLLRGVGALALMLGAAGALYSYSPPSSLRDRLCRFLPGTEFACALPEDKDLAILPFEIEGESETEMRLAGGVAAHLSKALPRLYPNRAEYCVHFRRNPSEIYSESMALLVRVSVKKGTATLTGEVRRVANQLLVRQIRREASLAEVDEVNAFLVDLVSRLGEEVSPQRVNAWRVKEAKATNAGIPYFAGLGYSNLTAGWTTPGLAPDWQQAALLLADATARGGLDFAPATIALANAHREGCRQLEDDEQCAVAENAYAQAQAASDFPLLYAEWGRLGLVRGDKESAVENLRRALAIDPYDFDTRSTLADAFESDQRVEDAESTWLEGVEVEPHCWRYRNALAAHYFNVRNYQDSEREMLHAIRLTPGHVAGYGNLARIYFVQGRYADAVQSARNALQGSPESGARDHLGRALYFQGCKTEGIDQLRLAVRHAPAQRYIIRLHLVELLMLDKRTGLEVKAQLEEALKEASRQIDRDPEGALGVLAQSHAWLGHVEEAVEAMKRLRVHDPSSRVTAVTGAVVAEILGQRGQAVDWLEVAFERGLSPSELLQNPALRPLMESEALRSMAQRLGVSLEVVAANTNPTPSNPCAGPEEEPAG